MFSILSIKMSFYCFRYWCDANSTKRSRLRPFCKLTLWRNSSIGGFSLSGKTCQTRILILKQYTKKTNLMYYSNEFRAQLNFRDPGKYRQFCKLTIFNVTLPFHHPLQGALLKSTLSQYPSSVAFVSVLCLCKSECD